MADHPSTVVVVTHDGMGSATAPLQHRLLKNYLTLLLENEMLPGVLLAKACGMVIDGSPVLGNCRRWQRGRLSSPGTCPN